MDEIEEESIQKRAARFEGRIRQLLNKMEFKDVNGGPAFKIGGMQIDVCGGHENTLLVIECYAPTKIKSSIREKLKGFKGSIPSIQTGIRKHEIYEKYSKVKYILAAKNILLNEENSKLAKESPPIEIWWEEFVDYYEHLSRTIKKYAKYNLLGEMGILPRVENQIKIPAFKIELRNNVAYLFFIDPRRLLEASYVARREVGKEKYYQRILKKKRIKEITDFVNKKGGFFPNNIIISLNEKSKFTPFKEIERETQDCWLKGMEFGILSFPFTYRSCWIIDGQHRLYAFSDSTVDSKIPVVAFDKLDTNKQAKLFIDINAEQKTVDSDLIWDLQGEMRPTDEEGIISRIVKKLNEEDPFKNKIYIPFYGKKKPGQLKLSGMCISIKRNRLVESVTAGNIKNLLYDDDSNKIVEKVSKALSAYFSIINNKYAENEKKGFFFHNTGVSVMIIIFERIMSAFSQYRSNMPIPSDIDKYLGITLSYTKDNYKDLKELRLKCTSEGGKSGVAEEFVEAINEKKDPSLLTLFAKSQPMEYEKEIINLEINLRDLIKNKLEMLSQNWYTERVPSNVYNRASEKAKQEDRDFFEFFTLGDCKVIIERKDNWNQIFKDIFIGEDKFTSDNLFWGGFDLILKFRNPKMHGRGKDWDTSQKDMLKSSINIMMRCIDKCSD